MISFYAPDAVFEGRAVGPTFEGRAAMRSLLEDWFGAYEELEFKLEDVRNLGNGVVFAVVVQEGVPAGSAGHGHFRQREGWVFLWERGLIARHSTDDIDAASAAAGRLAQERADAESTTPDLGERVRRSAEAANRGDHDTALSNFGPGSVWDDSAIGLGTHEGLLAIRSYYAEWIGSYEEFAIEIEEVFELGGEVTLLIALQKGRPVGASGYVQLQYASVATWTGGTIERFTTYNDIDQARAAAEGLAAERAQPDG